jgi:hypothetical protein
VRAPTEHIHDGMWYDIYMLDKLIHPRNEFCSKYCTKKVVEKILMNKYDVSGSVGEGEYGIVIKCRDRDNGSGTNTCFCFHL